MTGKIYLLINAVLLIISSGLCLGGDLEMCSFNNDPLCFHENLRRRAMEGLDNRSIIHKLHSDFGEHSFDGLVNAPSRGNAGFMLLYSAWVLWNDSRYDEARLHYTKARNIFMEADMVSEARFCLFYLARIETDQERFPESIRLLNQALAGYEADSSPYLEGLLNESLGYSLWYMDRLPESAESFGRAAELWLRIGYQPGMVNCWSNLGLLFQELDLQSQAWKSYENAIDCLQEDTFPEIKFHLYRNCALFHFRNNNPALASRYLLDCREFRECGEQLYILARAEILEEPALLEAIDPAAPSLVFIRDLLQARFRKKDGDFQGAISLIRKVIRESRERNMPRHTREAELYLAEILEEHGSTEEARRIFSDSLDESACFNKIDVLLPFSNSTERQLNGLIRCLIRSGRIDSARAAIHDAACLRTSKGRQLIAGLQSQLSTEPDTLLSRAVLEMEEAAPPGWGNAYQPASSLPDATILEFWPDGKELFVWIDNPRSRHFLRLELDAWIQDTLRMLTSALYSGESFLPPEPPRGTSTRLYLQLFLPLEQLIEKQRLLIISHKELQSLPFEMLQDGPGKYLLEKYTFSYLPGLHYLGRKSESHQDPPLLIQPEGFSGRKGAAAEIRSLKSLFPDLKTLNSLEIRNPLTASWIHLASHLRLDRRYWLNSSLAGGNSSKSMADILKRTMDCSLLSLGVCESANSATSASPYWMGFSEMLMLNGAESLLTSRWRMDELSASIYIDFFRLCHEGMPMDQALREARLKFLDPEKSGLPAEASHPFYWAGITYIGKPGKTLAGTPGKGFMAEALPVIFWLTLLAASCWP